MAESRRPLVWLHGEVKTPPFSAAARLETGVVLRRLQRGDAIGLPHVRPMPVLGARCAEIRNLRCDRNMAHPVSPGPGCSCHRRGVCEKDASNPKSILDTAKDRFRQYDRAIRREE